jgi:phage baseplate assembly protein W
MATYIGFNFPFSKGPTGFPASATDNDLIQQALIQLIMTGRGERIMRSDYGSNAYGFIFENTGAPTQMLIQTEIRNVIAKYEPRVLLQNVQVVVNNSTGLQPTLVTITINYIVLINSTNQQLNLTIGGQ